MMVERDVATTTTILVSPAASENANVEAAPKAKGVTDMNTQVGYIICVHRAATGIFGPISKLLDGNGTFLFFEDEARAQFVCDAHSMRPHVHYSIEPALNLTSPCSDDKSSHFWAAQEAAA
jgi:hypothetical protein